AAPRRLALEEADRLRPGRIGRSAEEDAEGSDPGQRRRHDHSGRRLVWVAPASELRRRDRHWWRYQRSAPAANASIAVADPERARRCQPLTCKGAPADPPRMIP